MKSPLLTFLTVLGISITQCFAAQTLASSNGNGNHRGRGNIKVTISPTSSIVQVGKSQQFSATVSGTNSASMNWLVNGVVGGNSSVGTISSAGLYTAPAGVPSGSVSVTAQCAAYPSSSATASVSIVSATAVSVSMSPTSASLQVNQSQQFNATVSGTSNTAVNWLVNGVVGGNSTVGTVSTYGMYRAPSSVPSVAVVLTAQSAAQSTASASATVSIAPQTVSVSISPLNVSLQVGQSQQFNSTVSGTSNTAVNWLVSGILGGNSSVGTVTNAGLYTAPTSVPASAVTVVAQSSASPTSSASAGVTVTQPVQHSVSLSWTDNGSAIAGFNVYRGSQLTGPFSRINSSLDTATVYTDNTVTSGKTYYYATTAVDSTGVESGYSNVAQAVVP